MSDPPNLLYYGDNLDVLRQHVKNETLDRLFLRHALCMALDIRLLGWV